MLDASASFYVLCEIGVLEFYQGCNVYFERLCAGVAKGLWVHAGFIRGLLDLFASIES